MNKLRSTFFHIFTSSLFTDCLDLIMKTLHKYAEERPTMKTILEHRWLQADPDDDQKMDMTDPRQHGMPETS